MSTIQCAKSHWKQEKMKTNSKSVSVNLKTYGKLLNHSDYVTDLVDV